MLRRFIINLMKITLDVSIIISILALALFLIFLLKLNVVGSGITGWGLTDRGISWIALYLGLAALGLVTTFGVISLLIEINENLIALRRLAGDRTLTRLATGSRIEPKINDGLR